jgi:hypothetical protein
MTVRKDDGGLVDARTSRVAQPGVGGTVDASTIPPVSCCRGKEERSCEKNARFEVLENPPLAHSLYPHYCAPGDEPSNVPGTEALPKVTPNWS